MTWQLRIANQAAKRLARVPRKDRERIAATIAQMCDNPFGGDIARLKNERAAWRRRVGNDRIFFDVDVDELLVSVTDIRRRTTTTY